MGRIKSALKNLSIKKTFMLYMLLFLVLAAALSSVTINVSEQVRNRINLSYSGLDSRFKLENNKYQVITAVPPVNYNTDDNVIINICSFIQVWSIPFYFGICIIFSALLFYRNKIKKPIEILDTASSKIAENNLNFNINYDSKDEMGQLCSSFESMRSSLEENSREMWRSMEERKRLNAAFSHDLRTPLTVLKGYSGLLKKYLPEDKINKEKLTDAVSKMSDHIERMENYVKVMSEVQSLEDISINMECVDTAAFFDQIRSTAAVLSADSEVKIILKNDIIEDQIYFDKGIISRVLENLIANSQRYAKSLIVISWRYILGRLTVTVSDDGKGFTEEDLREASKPYYRNKAAEVGFHFGLGLYICRILCEKHKGNLIIENGENSGASVTAGFLCELRNVDKK